MANWKKIIVSGSIPELFHISASGNIVPVTDDASNLGTANQQFKDLYIDGTAYIDSAQIDSLGAALDANNQAITNIDVNSGAIDGITLGTNSAVTEAQIDNVNIDGNTINASSGDLTITAAGGDISFGDENISLSGVISTTGNLLTTQLISGSKDLFIGKKGTSSISASNGTIELTGDITGSVSTTGSFGRIQVGNANNTFGGHILTLGGNLTTAGTFTTQNNNVTINAAGAARTLTLNESLTIGDGNDGTLTFSAGSKTITVEDDATVDQDLTTDAGVTFASVTTTDDVTVGGDLIINGSTTTIATSNLTIQDAFGFFATGSAGTNVDGGIIVQSGSADLTGSALYHDTGDERWAVAKTIASTQTAVSALQHVVTADTNGNNPPSATSGSYGAGEMWIDDSEDIWIRTS